MVILEENENIYLREIIPEDWEAMHIYASREDVCKFQPWGPNNEDDSMFFVNQAIRDAQPRYRRRFVFAIVEKKTEEVVGNIEMNIRDWDGVGEIGFIIHHEHWGKGLASEAALLMLKHGFGKCELQRIFATCDPRNISSIKVLEKIGMVKEGLLRHDVYVKNQWRDSYIYSMLLDEWKDEKEAD